MSANSSSQGPKTVTAVKTAVFKLHNPTQRKRAMLDHALLRNHLAYTKALKAAMPLVKTLVETELQSRVTDKELTARERSTHARLRKWERAAILKKRILSAIGGMPICGASRAARSLPGSIIGQIESYLELHETHATVGLPTVQPLRRDEVPYEQALHALVSSHTVEQEEAARIELMRVSRAGQLRPLLYSGNRAHDGFLLLRRETDNRYFIYLNLVPETSRFCRLTKVEQRTPSCRRIENLINMRTGEVVSFTSGTGCLFPIEFGRDYQDSEFLRRGSPLSAQLWKRGDRYEVQISFEFKAKQIEPKTILGSDRGIYNLASLAVIDQDGGVIERKNIDGMNLRMVQRAIERKHQQLQRRGKSFTGAARRHAANEAVHVAANAIVGLATKNHSQVVIENLSGLASTGGKRRRSRFNRILNRAQYQKLQKVLSYKLAVAGLPAAREVHPSYTSQACPFCGSISAENRLKTVTSDGVQTHEFKCVSCGFSDDADLNAARNIALKRLWRDGLSPALRTVNFNEVPENKSFSSFLKFRAERRGERACDRKVGSSGRAGLDAQYEDGEVAPGGNAVEPRSGSNTHASKNLPTMQSAVSPSDENSRPLAKSVRLPDG